MPTVKPEAISIEIARRGIRSTRDFASLMSCLMTDLIEGSIEPDVAKAVTGAGAMLLKSAEMQLRYGKPDSFIQIAEPPTQAIDREIRSLTGDQDDLDDEELVIKFFKEKGSGTAKDIGIWSDVVMDAKIPPGAITEILRDLKSKGRVTADDKGWSFVK